MLLNHANIPNGRMRPVVFFATPVALSAHQNFQSLTAQHACVRSTPLFRPPARRAAHALWSGGVPVPRSAATLGPRNLSKSPENISEWEGNAEQAWYDAIQARLCLAVLDLIIIRRCRDP
ncbi:hypothetical protein B0H13DRAFT_2317052 [Mycena leptocephala]|nr:hypothetical protein B0H13DRAFT_2317052 [Mycena leptocephala]